MKLAFAILKLAWDVTSLIAVVWALYLTVVAAIKEVKNG